MDPELLREIRLQSDDAAGLKAVNELVKRASQDALPYLLEELDTASWNRCKAIHDGVLKRTDSPLDALVSLIDPGRKSSTYWILRILGELGDHRAVPHLIAMLDGSCPEDCAFFLCQTLGKLRGPEAAGILVEQLKKTDDWFIQKTIIRTLGFLQAEETVTVLLDYLDSNEWVVCNAAFQSLVPFGELIVEPALARLASSQGHLRYFLPRLLGEIGAVKAIAPLQTEIKKETDPVDLANLVEAAGKISPEAFYYQLLPLAVSEHWMVRYRVFQALGSVMVKRNPEMLQQAEADPNWHVRTVVKLASSAAKREQPSS